MKRPNILLITTDQQRGDCLGLNGHPVLSTPNLDYLGQSGNNFTRAYTEVPSCIGARRTMLSGMRPVHHGMLGYHGDVEWDLPHSLPGELTRAGYQTQLVGKLHMFPYRKRYGFEHMLWSDHRGEKKSDYSDWLADNGATAIEARVAHGVSGNGWVARPFHLAEEFTHTNWCTREAVRFLDHRDPSQPFFLWLSYFSPHAPYTPPQLYYDRYMEQESPEPYLGDWEPRFDAPVRGLSPEASVGRVDDVTMHRLRAGYLGLINHIDDQIGFLLRIMRSWEQGLAGNTVIIFTSDHGDMLGDHHYFRKTLPYEGSARVPFFVNTPSWMGLPQGRTFDQVVGLQDLMPTILDAAGAPIPDSVDGRSVLSLIRQPETAWRDYLHGEHTGPLGMQYLTDGKEKYIWYTQTGEEQLFDLVGDPNELHNQAADEAAQRRLQLWRQRLVTELVGRPNKLSDGTHLIAGQPQITVLQLATV